MIFSVGVGYALDDATFVEDDPPANSVEVSSVYFGGAVSSLSWKDQLGNVGTVYFNEDISDGIEYEDGVGTFPKEVEEYRDVFDTAIQEASIEYKDSLQEPRIRSISFRSGDLGTVAWYDETGEYNRDSFWITEDGDVETWVGKLAIIESESEDTFNMLVDAILEEYESETR